MPDPEDSTEGKTVSPGDEQPKASGTYARSSGDGLKSVEFEQDLKTKRILFAVGFFGWYLINGGAWFLYSPNQNALGGQGYGIVLNLLLLPANAVLLLIFAIIRSTRRVALGILAAVAFNFFISLLLGLSTNATCFIPFFIK